ncbi:MAG: hypothetical protein OIF38_04030, partial [Cellvibrionaceae bacterium]|nr:hypothetical protein [Cellvibrionaceae bacterium]
TEDPTIRRQLGKLRIGDQIRIRGWLAEYGGSQGAIRGSGITRSDSGNGACETVYVRQFELLASNQSIWRSAWYFSLVLLLAQIIYYFSRPFKRK